MQKIDTTKNKTNPYILGLDVGTNSIGWAVVDCTISGEQTFTGFEPTGLRCLNSRIFQEAVDAKTRVPKNQKRREMRSVRNRLDYLKTRRQKLLKQLTNAEFLPAAFSQNPEKTLNQINKTFAERKLNEPYSDDWSTNKKSYLSPFAIRYFAHQERIELFELGRLFLHLQTRRGYFSNRGAKYIELLRELSFDIKKNRKR